MRKNLKEIFFSKVPPSMINFRDWTTENDVSVIGSFRSEYSEDFINPKEKFDQEMGKSGKDVDSRIPRIFQNLDFNGIDGNLKKAGNGTATFDPFLAPTRAPKYAPQYSTDKRTH